MPVIIAECPVWFRHLRAAPPSPKGTTTVTAIATDTSGNTATNTFTVTVLDTQPPVVTVWPPNQTLDVGGANAAAVPYLQWRWRRLTTAACIRDADPAAARW